MQAGDPVDDSQLNGDGPYGAGQMLVHVMAVPGSDAGGMRAMVQMIRPRPQAVVLDEGAGGQQVSGSQDV